MLLIFSATAVAQESQPAALAWQFAKGDQFSLEFSQQQRTLTRIDARDRTLESELLLGVQWSVSSVDADGNATIDQTIKRIRILTGAPGAEVKKTVDIDTAAEDTPRGVSRDVMQSVEKMVGLSFTVEMTAAGKVSAVTPAKNVAAVLDTIPETSALRQLFLADAMKRLIRDSTLALSEDAITADSSWKEDSDFSISTHDGRLLDFVRTVTSNATEITTQQAVIDVVIELSQKELPSAKVESALTSPLELVSFAGAGKMVFDREAGMLSSSKVTSELKTRVIYRQDLVQTTVTTTNRISVKKVN